MADNSVKQAHSTQSAPFSKENDAVPAQLKLRYFEARGRGESIRMLLKLANVPFTDDRIEWSRWPSAKEEMPFGQVPVLELDGGAVKLCQSIAILRYLGKKYGFAGATELENAKLDMIGDLIKDAWESDGDKWPLILFGILPEPEGGKEQYFREVVRPLLNKYAGYFENFLSENANDPLWNGEKLTWVYVLAAEFFSKYTDFGEPDCLDAFPRLQQLIARVHSLPIIKKHVQERPKTNC